MRYTVLIQPPAELDIEATFLYLRDRSPSSARKWMDGIHKAIKSLARMPGRFGLARESSEFTEEIRQIIYGRRSGRYRILYIVRGRTVHILHVRHGAQDELPTEELEQ